MYKAVAVILGSDGSSKNERIQGFKVETERTLTIK